MVDNKKLIYRNDYKSFAWNINEVFLNIEIFDEYVFTSISMNVQRKKNFDSEKNIYLNGENLELISVFLNNIKLKPDRYSKNENTLIIFNPQENFNLKIDSRLNPFSNTSLEGLYSSKDMLCTQCEPEGFRKIFYFPDRPDVMSIYTVRIEAPIKYKKLLSNGNLIKQKKISTQRHFALWNDPYPKPSYLFALVAGDLELVRDFYYTKSKKKIELNIYVEKGNSYLTGHAMQSLKKAMKWDEEVYGLEYDLNLFQIVAVSHFNMGAMENKGLNIFNSKFVLADEKTATDQDLDRVEAIIAHEYFHNWTGNRVTCRDWFQLTLKEGLTVFRDQCFSADIHDKVVKRIEDVKILRSIQFSEDAGPNAHPIRPESYIEINNFYTPTIYEKGAEVIRMIYGFLGEKAFFNGMKLYFIRHDGAAVTCEDFLSSMEDANNIDLKTFRRWYEQSGTPVLNIERRFSDKFFKLKFLQSFLPNQNKLNKNNLPIPIKFGLLDINGENIDFSVNKSKFKNEHFFNFTKKTETLLIETKDSKITDIVPSILRGFSAPVILNDDLKFDELCMLISNDNDLFNRYEASQRIYHYLIGLIIKNDSLSIIENELHKSLLTTLFNNKISDEFKSLIFNIPSQSESEQKFFPCDPVKIFKARESLKKFIGKMLFNEMRTLIFGKIDVSKSGGRALQNSLLLFSAFCADNDVFNLFMDQSNSENMTLSIGSISALNQIQSNFRIKALDNFQKKWSDNLLVMEKWFYFEASSPYIGDVKKINQLMRHKLYDQSNPNKIRSVLGAFSSGNPLQFHKNDGSGYLFLANEIKKLDKKNPQIAARLALSLTNNINFDDFRRNSMIEALKVINISKTSSDLSELVNKAIK